MGAPIQRLWHRTFYLPFLSFLRGHDPFPEPQRLRTRLRWTRWRSRSKNVGTPANQRPNRSRRRNGSAQIGSRPISSCRSWE
jgi:hypothetical protein